MLEGLVSHGDHSLSQEFGIETHIDDGSIISPDLLSAYKQSIYDPNGTNVVTSKTPQSLPAEFIKYIINHKIPTKHILLYGNGGMGKTFLLSHILLSISAEKDTKNVFNYVCAVSLSTLLNEAVNQMISDKIHESQLDKSSSDNNYLLRHFGIRLFNPQSTYLFLLDGYNEMMDRKTSRNFSIIEQIQDEISCLNIEGTYVIVTTRNKTDKKYFSGDYKLYTLSELEENPGIQFNCEISDEARKEITGLLKRPLFYSQYGKGGMKEIGSIKNVFELFLSFHKNAYKQSCEEKSTTDKSPYLVLYYIIAPYLAYEIDRTRSDHIDKTDALSIIKDWLNMKPEMIDRIKKITGKEMNQIDISDDPSFYWNLLKEFDFGELSDDIFHFRHQVWGDYFAAFYIVYSLKYIDSLTLDKLPTFNLKSSTQYYVMNAFDIEKTDDKSITPNRRKNYRDLFYKDLPAFLFRNLSLTKLKAWITRLYAAYSFNDHFMLHYLQERNDINQPFCDALMKHPDVVTQSGLETRYLDALIELYAGLIQYYRDDNLSKCREYYDFAENNLFHKDVDPMLKNCLIHQKGKALIFCAQYYYTKGKMPDELWDDMEPKEMFENGMELLNGCLPYNMSANLLGAIYSTPTMWILKNHLVERDVVKAYKIYDKAYRYLTEHVFLPEGTELIYTARQLVGLLLKGYVRLENGEPVASDIENVLPNEESLAYAKAILSHINGQDYYFVDWLRGICIVFEFILKNNKSNYHFEWQALQEAFPFFWKEKDHPLSMIVFLKKYLSGSTMETQAAKKFLEGFKRETNYLKEKDVLDALRSICASEENRNNLEAIFRQIVCESPDAIYYYYDLANLMMALDTSVRNKTKSVIELINSVLENPNTSENVEKLKNALKELLEVGE